MRLNFTHLEAIDEAVKDFLGLGVKGNSHFLADQCLRLDGEVGGGEGGGGEQKRFGNKLRALKRSQEQFIFSERCLDGHRAVGLGVRLGELVHMFVYGSPIMVRADLRFVIRQTTATKSALKPFP